MADENVVLELSDLAIDVTTSEAVNYFRVKNTSIQCYLPCVYIQEKSVDSKCNSSTSDLSSEQLKVDHESDLHLSIESDSSNEGDVTKYQDGDNMTFTLRRVKSFQGKLHATIMF